MITVKNDLFEEQTRQLRGLSNAEAINALRDRHRGRRAFVLGNGPSLNVQDLDRLKNEVTFAANKIYLAYDQTDWRPTYWCCSDKLVAANNAQRISKLTQIKIVAGVVADTLGHMPWTYVVPGPRDVDRGKTLRVSDMDLIAGTHPGVSVVVFMLKLAFWMGVEVVYLLGIDFDFTVPKNAETGQVIADNKVIVSAGEVNHFHPDYRKPGETWTMPLLNEQRTEFSQMRWRFESEGRAIFNASRKTKLGVFERIDFDDIVPPQVG